MEDSKDKHTEISFSVYAVNDKTQDEIRKSLQMILDSKGYGELLMPVFICVNELLVNAVKANFKNLYFENYAPKNKPSLPYRKALELFRHEIKNNGAAHLEKLSREKNIYAKVHVTISGGNTLEAIICNPYPMTEIEINNVAKRLEAFEKINEISDYFALNEKESLYEGAGLGLIFIGMVLKSMSLTASHLTIRSDKHETTASLSIPLNRKVLESYQEIAHIPNI
jgi:hypothetical protein